MGYRRVGFAETDLWVPPMMLQLAWNIVIFGEKGSRDVMEWAELSNQARNWPDATCTQRHRASAVIYNAICKRIKVSGRYLNPQY